MAQLVKPSNGRTRPGCALAVALAAVLHLCAPLSVASGNDSDKVRGIVISTHTDGREWGQDSIAETLDEIRAVGADWVAIHPYAGVRGDGSVRFREFDPADPPAYLTRPIREAHARGLKILIKPHLAYWGSPFAWRGEIEFEDTEQWQRFFREYGEWVAAVARATREADGFVVGTELDRTLGHEAQWRRIIARVRETTSAPLTYAANWTDYRRVPFWEALDVIGVQAYFPIAHDPDPALAALVAGWGTRMAELREYAERLDRKIVFTELGYNRSLSAAREPWAYRVDGPEAEELQEQLLGIALRAIEAEPAVVGVFLWKWFAGPHPVGRNFQLATPRLKRAIAEVWLARPSVGRQD
jgi:hypothetical protein